MAPIVFAVILAGGRGERFWPKSRKRLPKQFLPLVSDRTMLQLTLDRIRQLVPPESVLVVTEQELAPHVQAQLPELPQDNLILEPSGRDTAAAIGLAALAVRDRNPDALMVVLPADHLIRDSEEFLSVIQAGIDHAACHPGIVTIGIPPAYPETGFGYMKKGPIVRTVGARPAFQVLAFTEKPDRSTAQRYLESGAYFWNSGMFIWKVGTILDLIAQHLPELDSGLTALVPGASAEDRQRVLCEIYPSLPKISIDRGVIEKARQIVVFPGSFGWDDLGTWAALERICPTDTQGNVVRGQALTIDSSGCIVESRHRLVAALGMQDLIVVDTEDVLLVCPKHRVQDIKRVTAALRDQGFDHYL